MRSYNVTLVQPEGYAPAYSFLEVGRLLLLSLRSLGLQCSFSANRISGSDVNVLLGYHLLPGPSPALAGADYVIYQLEQLPGHPEFPLEGHLELFRGARAVWDYSSENVAFLREQGLRNVALLPLGFHEGLSTIRQGSEDIDVLFYGLINQRRAAVLGDLARSLRVESLFGLYSDSRDAYVGHSKIVLNVHYYPVQIFEQVRVSYLLNNRRFVISEDSAHNPYEGGLVTGPLSELPELCRRYLANPEARARIARQGYELFRQQPMVELVRRVL